MKTAVKPSDILRNQQANVDRLNEIIREASDPRTSGEGRTLRLQGAIALAHHIANQLSRFLKK